MSRAPQGGWHWRGSASALVLQPGQNGGACDGASSLGELSLFCHGTFLLCLQWDLLKIIAVCMCMQIYECMYRLSREKDNPGIFQIQSGTVPVKDQMEAMCYRHDTVFLMKLQQYLEEGK